MMQHFHIILAGALITMSSVGHTDSYKILGLVHLNSRSHFVMFEALFKGLAAKGHDVYVVSHFPQKEPIPNYTDISLQGTLPDVVNNFTVEFVRNFGYINLLHYLWYTIADMCEVALQHPSFQKLLSTNEKFDLIITEIVSPDCFLFLSRKFNAPAISLTTSVAFPWGNDRFANPENPSYIPNYFVGFTDRMNFFERLICTVTLLFAKVGNYYIGEPNMEKVLRKHYGNTLPSLSEQQKDTSLILVNSHFSFNFPRPAVPAFIEVGGLHIHPAGKLPKDLETFINEAEHGVVYFSLGSLVKGETLPQEKLQIFIDVFKDLPQRVVWKIDNIKGLPKNIWTSKWMPQLEILSHPNVRAFISHGGLMGTQEAVYKGIPIVGIPLFADQELNIRNCVSKGIAIMLDYDLISRESLSQALTEVLQDPRYQRNSKKMSELFRDRPQTPLETAIYWTEYVIRHGGAPHLKSAAVDLPLYQYLLLDVTAVILLTIGAILSIFYYVMKRILSLCCPNKSAKKLKHN